MARIYRDWNTFIYPSVWSLDRALRVLGNHWRVSLCFRPLPAFLAHVLTFWSSRVASPFPTMWAKYGGRRIGLATGRFFSSAPGRPSATSGAPSRSAFARSQSRPPNWSGRSVFALSATAGLFGFGLAALGIEHPQPRPIMLFDSKITSPQYASAQEMETVSRPRPPACRPITYKDCP